MKSFWLGIVTTCITVVCIYFYIGVFNITDTGWQGFSLVIAFIIIWPSVCVFGTICDRLIGTRLLLRFLWFPVLGLMAGMSLTIFYNVLLSLLFGSNISYPSMQMFKFCVSLGGLSATIYVIISWVIDVLVGLVEA